MEIKKDERLFPRTIKDVKELEAYYKKDITQLIDDLDRWVNHKQFVHSKCYVVGNGLSRKGIDLEKSSIRLPDGTLKEVGEYSIDIELHPEVVQNIKVVISAKEEN